MTILSSWLYTTLWTQTFQFQVFLPEDTSNDLQFLLFSEHVQNEVIRHPGLNATELT